MESHGEKPQRGKEGVFPHEGDLGGKISRIPWVGAQQ